MSMGFRKIGMGICLAAMLTGGGISITHAQTLMNAQQFLSNPQALASAPGGITTNAVNILGTSNGNPQAISELGNFLGGMPGSQTNPQQATGILQTLQQGMSSGQFSPQQATALLGGITSNPQLTQALTNVPGLGQMTGSVGNIQQVMNNPAVQNALGGLSGMQQAAGVDQIVQSVTQGAAQNLTTAATQELANQIAANMPDLANMMGGANGIAQNLQNMLGGAGGLLGGLFGGSGTGGAGSGGGGAGAGGSGQDRDNGNYELESMDTGGPGAQNACGNCSDVGTIIKGHYTEVRQTIKDEFIKHRNWIVNTYWKEHILPALMLMAEQLTAVGIAQVEMIGAMLDAKHQLETQRLFQQLTAQAHKDYHPSEGMCTFGTSVRSLAASERKSDMTQVGLAARMMQRQTLNGDVLSIQGDSSDIVSRMSRFRTTYCDPLDNASGLDVFCKDADSASERRNIDVDFTRNVESRLTLDIDMTQDGADTDDQQDLFALSANLFWNNVAMRIDPEKLANDQGLVREDGAGRLLDLRAVYAKRSVAQNSFAALAAMRASGDEGSAPYTKALIKELGITSQDEIEKILGEKPSYFAQMEVLTKKIYQNPSFYTELYDKPVNVERKGAAIEAISLMQDRDLYNSLLRSEAVLSVLLETMLMKEQSKIVNAMPETD